MKKLILFNLIALAHASNSHITKDESSGGGWILGILFFVFIAWAVSKPSLCSVCGLRLKRKYYSWKIEDKTQYLCPKCNSRMEGKVSKQAFKNKFG